MTSYNPDILYDENVLPAIIRLIEEARRQIVLVSPYNDFSNNLRDAVSAASKKPNLRLIMVGRKDQADKERKHFESMAALGAEVHLVERLHSKIYMNESTAIVTSMNLSQGSAVNSKEIAFRLTDAASREAIVQYVRDRLVAHSEVLSKPTPSTAPSSSRKRNTAPIKNLGPFPSNPRVPRAKVGGTCIRCEAKIKYDTLHPLCDDCYTVWKRYSDPDYIENTCHKCGRDWDTTYAKPLCITCFRKENR